MCRTCGENNHYFSGDQAAGPGQNVSLNVAQGGPAQARELPPYGRTIATGNREAQAKTLKRGSYKVVSRVKYFKPVPSIIQNEQKIIDINGEAKRVFFHKIEHRDVKETAPGEFSAKQIIVYDLIDNPVGPAPVVKAAEVVATGQADPDPQIESVEEFTAWGWAELATLAGTVVTIFLLLKNLWK